MSASSDDAVIIPRPKKCSSIFDSFVQLQRQSFDVVIFSNVVKDAVSVAWPLDASGDKLPPAQIVEWLGGRRLYWSCFCGLTAPLGVYFPCQFVLSVSGDILGYCYHRPSVCKFLINLSAVFKTTDLVSPYTCIQPVVGRPSIPQLSEALLAEFLQKKYQSTEIPPYFQDYCGDFDFGYKQIITQDPQRSTIGRTAIRRKSRHFISAPLRDPPSLIEGHEEVLRALMAGKGVSKSDWDGLVMQCDTCEWFYLSTALESHHSGSCSYESSD